MNMYDFMFWWMGVILYCCLVLLFLFAVVYLEFQALIVIYRKRKQWWMAKIVCENKDRDLILAAFRFAGNAGFKSGQDLCKWLDKAHTEYEIARKKGVQVED